MKLRAIAVALPLIALAGCTAAPAAPAPTVTVTATPTPETMTVSGALTLTDSGVRTASNGSSCYGSGGFSDIREGAQVVVTDASGKSVGLGQLGPGALQGSPVVCEFAFSVYDVPVGDSAVFGVQVSHRGVINFTKQNASRISLSLG